MRFVRQVMAAGALVATCVAIVSGAESRPPHVVPDPRNPGYYQPFTCVAFEPGQGPFGQTGRIRNNCGHSVEAHWRSGPNSTGSMATIGAGGWHTVHEAFSGGLLACLPNGTANRSLGLCKDDRPGKVANSPAASGSASGAAEADRLAAALGMPGSSSGGGSRSGATEADRLAAALGMRGSSSASPNLSGSAEADRLEAALRQRQLEENERQQREEAARVIAKQREEESRLAALERERQLALDRQRRMAVLEEQQSTASQENKSSLFGSVLSAGAVFAGAKAGGMDTASAATFAANAISENDSSTASGRPRPESCPASKKSQIENAIKQINSDSSSLCATGRNYLSVADRLETIFAGQCSEYQYQVDYLREQGRAYLGACAR